MARREALIKLHKQLSARRTALRKVLAREVEDLQAVKEDRDMSGDAADAAFGTGVEEVASQLAEIEARELAQIDRAILRLKQGKYGQCEVCEKRIPVARLAALPYSTLCIECQRERERHPRGGPGFDRGNWEKVYDTHSRLEDQREVNLNEIEMDLSASR